VAVCGEVRAAVAEHTAPVEAVLGEVASSQVLDRDTVGADDAHTVGAPAITVENGAIAIGAAQHDPVRGDGHALVVDACADEHEITRTGPVDGLLDAPRVAGDTDGPSGRGNVRRCARARADGCTLGRTRARSRRARERGERRGDEHRDARDGDRAPCGRHRRVRAAGFLWRLPFDPLPTPWLGASNVRATSITVRTPKPP